jgi:nickel-dependent lactate racemase
MAQIQLQYGQSSLGLNLPGDRYKILSGNEQSSVALTDEQIGAAFDTPIESKPLHELFASGDSVLLVVSDATRATACDQIVNLFVRRLIELGVSPRDIAIIFATGIHRHVTAAEKIQLLTPFIVQRVRTLDHDANDGSSMISFGTTERGTPVEVNRALKDFSHIVTISGVAFHYFAGFTGGRKSICPGLASARTIEATHMLALDFQTGGRRAGVDTAKLAGNAVNEECDRIADLVGPRLGINTIVNERGRAVKVFCGEPHACHRTACAEYLAGHSVEIEAKRELVLVSCGGLPYDINVIQAHKL